MVEVDNGPMITQLQQGRTMELDLGILIKVISTIEESQRALQFYAMVAVKDNPFISQMRISAEQFYQEGLSNLVQPIADDKLSCIAFTKETNEVVSVSLAIDSYSSQGVKPFINVHPMLMGRQGMFSKIENEYIAKFGNQKRGHLVHWIAGAVLPTFQQKSVFKHLNYLWMQFLAQSGYEIAYGFAANPITQRLSTKFLDIISTELIPFDTFTYEGAIHFKGFKFSIKTEYPPGILALIYNLRLKIEPEPSPNL